MSDALSVLLRGEQTAMLRRTRSERLELQYLDDAGACVSLSMKPRAKPYAGEVVFNWIDNLVPDDERLRSAWARDNRAASISPFDLLATRIGEDCAGAVQFIPADQIERLQARGGAVDVVDDTWIEDRLAKLRHAADSWQNLDHSRLMYSIGGLQPKLGLHKTSDGRWAQPRGDVPTTHILKPAPRQEWPHLDLNEHISLTAARTLGVASATTSYEYFGNQSAVVIERFDRMHRHGEWRRLHAEDLCQAFGVRPDQKVQYRGGPSVPDIARLLRANAANAADGDRSVQRFGQALALSWAIVASDAHAKNYTIVHLENGSVTLAPLYDVSTNLGHLHTVADPAELEAVALAMPIGNDHTIGSATTPSTWRDLAKSLRIDRDYLLGEARRLSAGFGDAAQAEITRLDHGGQLHEDDRLFCTQMMPRIRAWERHVRSLPAMSPKKTTSQAILPTPPAKQAASTVVRCNQRIRNGGLCNRRLRDAPCPLHPSSPGSRQISAR